MLVAGLHTVRVVADTLRSYQCMDISQSYFREGCCAFIFFSTTNLINTELSLAGENMNIPIPHLDVNDFLRIYSFKETDKTILVTPSNQVVSPQFRAPVFNSEETIAKVPLYLGYQDSDLPTKNFFRQGDQVMMRPKYRHLFENVESYVQEVYDRIAKPQTIQDMAFIEPEEFIESVTRGQKRNMHQPSMQQYELIQAYFLSQDFLFENNKSQQAADAFFNNAPITEHKKLRDLTNSYKQYLK